MDSEAVATERDPLPADEADPQERSRFAVRWPRAAGWWDEWRRTVLLAVGCTAALLLVSNFVVEPFEVPSGSMESTLRVGDRVLVDKLAYRFGGTPRRGDVIVFDGKDSFSTSGGTDYVKRVIGVGGDRVTCCDKQGRLMVNGHPIDEPYVHPGDQPSQVPFDIEVPQGRLWVMGDHRDDSRDSRDHLGDPGGGTVPVGKVIGRADWIAWPVGHWTRLRRPDDFAAVPAPAAASPGPSGTAAASASPSPAGRHG
ncbi:signal peptidase I Serine peptidase. MEROPS family S26A [Actinacidiphila rubida]|uniref:Signal peptidase I n=1 Tax=Actinacidiphila rubida TaxID=310780 RepID=A0A1H8L711_9ACTN|nr:signal peptidase I [Actinacidiphila rubida]SEO00885.1 signal peptidase I Serine peptidase. MEROPS family S26A [Actinacidiphila rubida]